MTVIQTQISSLSLKNLALKQGWQTVASGPSSVCYLFLLQQKLYGSQSLNRLPLGPYSKKLLISFLKEYNDNNS